jgi:hypothetical protein
MTRAEATARLRLCSGEKHWITTPSCDSCWVNEHRCPATLGEISAWAKEAEDLSRRLRELKTKVGV